MSTPTRFENTKEHLSTFADVFYVRCPSCGGCATVREIESDIAHGFAHHEVSGPDMWIGAGTFARCICTKCCHIKDVKTNGYSYGDATDWYFNLPLWFQTPCCGETLWAYNRPHLAYLKRYVEADLRDECSYPNTGLARYLPKWIKAAKNRDEVLKCIQKLMQV